MKVAIFGLGYVGCTAAGCIASQGHSVIGIDPSTLKVAALTAGQSPIIEPGLDTMIADAVAAGRLTAHHDAAGHLDDSDIAIVCVGTPSGHDGAHNMAYIVQVTRDIANALKAERSAPLTVAYRSTMRPGSIDQIITPIFRDILGDDFERKVELVYNPEFLREATAVDDYFNPPKIVIGTRDGTPSANMEALHDGIDASVFTVGIREAEFTKFVDNTWHAVKVAFANEIGRVCTQLHISATDVHSIFAADTKLNLSAYYTRPGGPFGGSCLPKDVRALQYVASDVGANTHLVDALLRSNEAHKHFQFQQVAARLPQGGRVLVAGLAFKAGTDDLRESPALDLTRKLVDSGYRVSVYDPALCPSKLVGQNMGYAYAHLPTIDTLLIDKDAAESGAFDLVVATNGTVRDLTIDADTILDLSLIA